MSKNNQTPMKNIKSQLEEIKKQKEAFEKAEQATIKVANLEIEKAALKAAIKTAKDLGLLEVASEKENALNAVLKEQEETKELMQVDTAPQPQEQQQINLQTQPQDAESIVNAFLDLDIDEAQAVLKKLSNEEQEKQIHYMGELENAGSAADCILNQIKSNPEYKDNDEDNKPEYVLQLAKIATFEKAIECSKNKQDFYEVISKNIDNPLGKLTEEVTAKAIQELEKSPAFTMKDQRNHVKKLGELCLGCNSVTSSVEERINAAEQMKPALQEAANNGLMLCDYHNDFFEDTLSAEQALKENKH